MHWLAALTGFVLLLALQTPACAQQTLDRWAESFQAQFKSKWQHPASQKTTLVLSLRINRSGYPVAVEVLEPPEEPELIQAAVEAVRKAGPYLPLPAQLEAPLAEVTLTLPVQGEPTVTAEPRSTFLGLALRNVPAREGKPAELAILGWSSPQAKSSGLRLNDRLLAIDGKPVLKSAELGPLLKNYKPGNTVSLKIKRDKQELEVPLELSASSNRVPSIDEDEPPRKAVRLQPLSPASSLLAEQVFGWGNVITTRQETHKLIVTVGPLRSETALRALTAAFFPQVRSQGIESLTVRVEAPEIQRSWQADTDGTALTVQPYIADWRTTPLKLPRGTILPVRLDLTEEEGIRQGVTKPLTGKILYDVHDDNGIPLIKAGTVVSGNLVPAPPFGHRMVLDTLGKDKLSVAAESGVLPTQELLIEREGSVISAQASVLHSGQVVGLEVSRAMALPQTAVPGTVSAEPSKTVEAQGDAAIASDGRNEKQALELYNQGLQRANQAGWEGAIEKFRASLSRFPSVQSRAALGWAYERSSRQLLALDDPTAALERLELALRLQPQISNTLTLLSYTCARLLDQPTDEQSDARLSYYRNRATTYGLSLPDDLDGIGFLVTEVAKPAQGNYLDDVTPSYFGGTTTNVLRKEHTYIRLTRMPVTVYIGAAPSPELAAVVWNAARKWQVGTDNAVQLAKVSQPTEADVLVYFTALEGTRYVGLTETRPVTSNPRAFGNKLAALQIQLNLGEALLYHSRDRLKYVEDVAVHEFGHALGLNGHSTSIDDIMYPVVNGILEPSPRDLATLKKLYSIPPDITRP